MAKGKKDGAVAVVNESTDMVVVTDQVPDYINTASARGNENVGTADLVIPRLEIVQALSPAVKPGDPGFIEGATMGMLNNSVTRELYGSSVLVVPIFYMKQYLVWKDRKKGGGFFGAYDSMKEAEERAEAEGGAQNGVEVMDTPQHFCLLLGSARRLDEVMISMPRTKAKISRNWNSMIKLMGGDRFSRVYRIGTALEKKEKGDFYNFSVEPAGFPNKSVYAAASLLYEKVATGARQVVMDTSGLDEPGETGANSEM